MGTESVLIVALVSTIAFFCYFLFMGAGESDADTIAHDGLAYAAEGWSILQFLSVQLVLLSVMSYSWSWLFFSQRLEGTPLQIGATLVVGSAMVALYVGLMKAIRRLNSSDTIQGFRPAAGMKATVYSRVPAKGEAVGVVTFLDRRLGDVMMDATTLSDMDIQNGAEVVVTEVRHRQVVVAPAA
jgi:hypothetical protein